MSSVYKGGFILATQQDRVLPTSSPSDLLIYTGNSNQNIHIGCSNSKTTFIRIASNADTDFTGIMTVHSNICMSNTIGKSTFYSLSNYIGINNPLPSEALDVNGNIKLYGNIENIAASIYKAGFALSKSSQWVLSDSTSNDLLIYTGLNNQNILIGCSNSQKSFIKIASNADTDFAGIMTVHSNICMSNTIGKSTLYSLSNYIGINNPLPSQSLDVNGNISLSGNLENIVASVYKGGFALSKNPAWVLSNSSVNDLMIYTGNSNQNILIGCSNSSKTFIKISSNADTDFVGIMTLHSNICLSNTVGKSTLYSLSNFIGINNPTPSEALDISGNIKLSGNFSCSAITSTLITSQNTISGSLSNTYGFSTKNASINGVLVMDQVFIYSVGGNLGINQPNPVCALDVIGDVNFSGNLVKNGQNFSAVQWQASQSNVFLTFSNVGIHTPTPLYPLDVSGKARVTSDFYIGGNSSNAGIASFGGNVNISGSTSLSNAFYVTGPSVFINTVDIRDRFTSYSNVNFMGQVNVFNTSSFHSNMSCDTTFTTNTLIVQSNATLSNVYVSGLVTVNNKFDVYDTATFHSNVVFLASASTPLNVSGPLEVQNYANFHSNVIVTGSTMLSNTLDVYFPANIQSNLVVTGYTTLSNTLNVYNPTNLRSNLVVSGNTIMSNSLDVYNPTNIRSNLTITGPTIMSNTLDVFNQAILRSNLTVTGSTTMCNTLDIYNQVNLRSNLYVTGPSTLSNTLDVYNQTTIRSNLYVTGPSTLSNTLDVYNQVNLRSNLYVSGPSTMSNTLDVYNSTNLRSNLVVTGKTTLSNTLDVYNPTNLRSNLVITGPTTMSNTLDVYNPTNLRSNLVVTGPTTMSNTLDVYNQTTLRSNLYVIGPTTMSNTLDVNNQTTLRSNLYVIGPAIMSNTLNVYNETNLQSNLTVSGATTMNNTLDVYSYTNIRSNLIVTGPTTLSNTLDVYNTTTVKSNLQVSGMTEMTDIFASGDTTLNGNVNIDGQGIFQVQVASIFSSNLSCDGNAAFNNIDFSGSLTNNGFPFVSGSGSGGGGGGTLLGPLNSNTIITSSNDNVHNVISYASIDLFGYNYSGTALSNINPYTYAFGNDGHSVITHYGIELLNGGSTDASKSNQAYSLSNVCYDVVSWNGVEMVNSVTPSNLYPLFNADQAFTFLYDVINSLTTRILILESHFP